jgi:hypothetical protein
MSKPWDKLRVPKKPVVEPIGKGFWVPDDSAWVYFDGVHIDKAMLRLSNEKTCSYFCADGLRQLAEFCNELADQLEGK